VIKSLKPIVTKLLPKNQFARSVAVLTGGTASVQLLLVLAAPILTRLYTPEDFGLLAVFVSILGILSIIASLRYELAIPIAEDDKTALHLVVLCLLVVIAMAFLSGVIIFLAGDWIVNVLDAKSLGSYLYLLPVGVLLIGF